MMNMERRLRHTAYALVILIPLSMGALLWGAWVMADSTAFERSEKTTATVIESARYFDSGYYAPVDLDGDGVPDEWLLGEFESGQQVPVVVADDKVRAEPSLGEKVLVGMALGLIGGLGMAVTLLMMSPRIERWAAIRSRHD